MTLSLTAKAFLLLKMRVNILITTLEFHMTSNIHGDLAFDLCHDLEGHMKGKNIYWKIGRHF